MRGVGEAAYPIEPSYQPTNPPIKPVYHGSSHFSLSNPLSKAAYHMRGVVDGAFEVAEVLVEPTGQGRVRALVEA